MKVDTQQVDKITQFDFERGEILNLCKPEGWTSFDVVKKVRNLVKVKKVGHAGTLDPFATGVLLVCTGRATKKVTELVQLKKEYVATLELGKVTDTYDRTGAIVEESEIPEIQLSELQNLCNSLVGEIYQTPPMYSAVKVNGIRLYNLARKGKVIEREPRKVNIYDIKILNFEIPLITLKVICSKGTYIRALAHDIGARLSCGAYLISLTRTRVGPYKIEDAHTIPNFERLINSYSFEVDGNILGS
jgi:tRNA pseudouridine55 synthase